MILKTVALQNFLAIKSHPDMRDLYTPDMECQVNAAQDGGTRVENDYHGRRWHGWTDGLTTWKSFRIPFKAKSEPEYTDSEMTWDLESHAEAIGLTGWDWKNRCSRWVAFDFDALMGHSDKHKTKLSSADLDAVRDAACSIDWVTVRRSTSGKGLHLYVFLDCVPTANHTEHAALGRAIIGKLSAIAAYDFESKVDTCGGNMWVWHRKSLGTNGFETIKNGIPLTVVPPNWKDHVKVISGERRKNLPQDILENKTEDVFEELVSQRTRIALDEEHKKLIDYLKEVDAFWWWDQDNAMLVTHTHWLKQAHEALSLKGYFDTISPATNVHEQNCFAFPLRKGAWCVRRYSPGIQEHESWSQDQQGWTRCYYNRDVDFSTACRTFGGIENKKGAFVFREAEIAQRAAALIGTHFKVGTQQIGRRTILSMSKDGRVLIEVDRDPQDQGNEMNGWLAEKTTWQRLFNVNKADNIETESQTYDDIIRHIVTLSDEDYGWVIKADGVWRSEPLAHVKLLLGSMGFSTGDITEILGASISRCWRLVNKPFQPEYPGDREWNKTAAQLFYKPTENIENLRYPAWLKILRHIGSGIDECVSSNGWCMANGIKTGSDYLKCWIASIFQYPFEPLPYLFLYGPQNSGKSILHESLSLLMTMGVKRADAALTSQSGFNGELDGALVCVVEETDLKRNVIAYNRIKDWVTSIELPIRALYKTLYHIPNTTHWIQCNNNHEACPIFPGDTRITTIYVPALSPVDQVPKFRFLEDLRKEAPDFLAELMSLEIPESDERLRIPVLMGEDKALMESLNKSSLESFVEEHCDEIEGNFTSFTDFYDAFIAWVEPNERSSWTKIKVGRSLPPKYPKGRWRKNGHHYIGNIGLKGSDPNPVFEGRVVYRDGFLDEVHS